MPLKKSSKALKTAVERTLIFLFKINAFQFSLVAFPARIEEKILFQCHIKRQKSISIHISQRKVYIAIRNALHEVHFNSH